MTLQKLCLCGRVNLSQILVGLTQSSPFLHFYFSFFFIKILKIEYVCFFTLAQNFCFFSWNIFCLINDTMYIILHLMTIFVFLNLYGAYVVVVCLFLHALFCLLRLKWVSCFFPASAISIILCKHFDVLNSAKNFPIFYSYWNLCVFEEFSFSNKRLFNFLGICFFKFWLML